MVADRLCSQARWDLIILRTEPQYIFSRKLRHTLGRGIDALYLFIA